MGRVKRSGQGKEIRTRSFFEMGMIAGGRCIFVCGLGWIGLGVSSRNRFYGDARRGSRDVRCKEWLEC